MFQIIFYLKLFPKPLACCRVWLNISYFLMSLSETDLELKQGVRNGLAETMSDNVQNTPSRKLHRLLEVSLGDLRHKILIIIHIHSCSLKIVKDK